MDCYSSPWPLWWNKEIMPDVPTICWHVCINSCNFKETYCELYSFHTNSIENIFTRLNLSTKYSDFVIEPVNMCHQYEWEIQSTYKINPHATFFFYFDPYARRANAQMIQTADTAVAATNKKKQTKEQTTTTALTITIRHTFRVFCWTHPQT